MPITGSVWPAKFADTLDANPYKSWVDMYKTDEFWQGSVWLIDHIERLAADLSEERKRELVDIFVTGVGERVHVLGQRL